MKCRAIMSAQLTTCAPGTTVREAAVTMRTQRVGLLPVVDGEGRVLGVVTDRDLATRVLAEGRSSETPVDEIMTREVITCREEDPVLDAEEIIARTRRTRLLVLDAEDRLVGILSLTDIGLHSSPIRAGRLLQAVATRKTHSGAWQTPRMNGS